MHFPTFIFLATIFSAQSSLLSRFRNPNTYVAREEDFVVPEDLDDDLYAELIREVPEYKGLLRPKAPPRLPYLKQTPALEPTEQFDPDDYEDPTSEDTEETREVYTLINDVENATELVANEYNMTNSSDSRRGWFSQWSWKGKKVATCYVCNKWPSQVPTETSCHDAFESHNWKMRTLARYFRAECYHNVLFWGERIKWHKHPYYHLKWYYSDRGLKREFIGPYRTGCIKRYLDVGKVYTQRLCRGAWPMDVGGFTNHRMKRLELTLKNKDEGCVMSPHASLTPFARGISLFARYHLCVCQGKYCNSATDHVCFYHLPSLTVIFIIFRFYLF